MQEEEILKRCINGDRAGQKALYDKYKTQMYTLAYRITNNFEDADDVLQEGFIKVFNHIEQFRSESKLSSWIHTIISRTAYRKIEKKVHFMELEDKLEDHNIFWPESIDTEYLEKAILSLPDGYRTIFVLYEIEGYKHKEIAEMMSISVNTSKTQLRKAKLTLQEKLQQFN